jgi:hypothetical protein
MHAPDTQSPAKPTLTFRVLQLPADDQRERLVRDLQLNAVRRLAETALGSYPAPRIAIMEGPNV